MFAAHHKGTPATKAFTDLESVIRFIGQRKAGNPGLMGWNAFATLQDDEEVSLSDAFDVVSRKNFERHFGEAYRNKRFAQMIHALKKFMIRHTKAQRIAVRCRRYSLACHALQKLSRKPEPRFDGCRGNRR